MTALNATEQLHDWVPRIYRSSLNTGRASLGEMLGGHVEVESHGSWVISSQGRRFLNAGGYGVFMTGARHPRVVSEVARQLGRHPIATRMFMEPSLARAADALHSIVPAALNRVHFSGSGAEAVEAAIKIARGNGRDHLVSMINGYHGKTMGALSLTANPLYQSRFQPLLPWVTHVAYGSLPDLDAVLSEHPGRAAVVLEPVQGEAGVIIPPPGYLNGVARLCRRHGALLILDEIQTGFGRCGRWWAGDYEGVTPDILLAGKSLGGGVMPVAATVTSAEVLGVLDRDPFLHTSTFSGAPLQMAAVVGAINAMREEGLVERASALGLRLLTELKQIIARHFGESNVEVRGLGLLLGIEFRQPAIAGELLLELLGQNVIANHSLNASSVLRLTPPAVLSESEFDFLLSALDNACRTTAERCLMEG